MGSCRIEVVYRVVAALTQVRFLARASFCVLKMSLGAKSFVSHVTGLNEEETDRAMSEKLSRGFLLKNVKNEPSPKGKVPFDGAPKIPTLRRSDKGWKASDLPQSLKSFSLYEGLHKLWIQYMAGLMHPVLGYATDARYFYSY